jgi:uncharacterized protein (TIGR02646 family)
MILLKAVPRPAQLTDEVVRQLTELFKADKSQRVWDKLYIKEALLLMSHGKCCYCECKIDEESKYLEVEHYHPKDKYEDEVLAWENLLPACKRCNGKKRNHDSKIDPIIHPVKTDPRQELAYSNYLFKSTTVLGQTTVDVLDLNDRKRLVDKRYSIGEKTKDMLAIAIDLIKSNDNFELSLNFQIRVYNILRNIMREGQPNSAYSAVVATAILTGDAYHTIKQTLSNLSLWDVDMQQLETELYNIAYLPSQA